MSLTSTALFKPIVLIISIIAALSTNAQNTATYNLNTDNGLSFNKIYDMQLSNEGYLVMCTEKGIFKLNGSSVTEIPWAGKRSDEILRIEKDDQKRLWGLGLNNTLYRIEKDTVYKQFEWNKDNSTIFSCVIKGDTAWLSSSYESLHYYIISTHRFDSISVKEDIAFRRVMPKIVLPNKVIYTVHYLNQDASSLKEINLKTKTTSTLLKSYRVDISLAVMHNGSQYLFKNWRFSSNEGFVFQEDSVIATTDINIFLQDFAINRIVSYNENLFFLGKTGLKIFNTVTGKGRFLLQDIEVTSCYLMPGNRLWVSTLDKGLFYLPNLLSNTKNSSNSALSNSHVTEIENIDSTLFIADKQGNIYKKNIGKPIELFHKQSVLIKTFLKSSIDPKNIIYFSNNREFIAIEKEKSSYKMSHHNSFSANKDFSKWNNIVLSSSSESATIQTNDKSVLFKFLPKKLIEENTTQHAFKKRHSVTLADTRSSLNLINYTDSSLWIAVRSHLLRFTRTSIDTIRTDNNEIIATTIAQEKNGVVWIGTSTGILAFNGPKEIQLPAKLKVLQKEGINKISYSGNSVFIATDKGLFEWKNKILTQTTTLNGLASNSVTDAIRIDSHLYVTTKNGLTIFENQSSSNSTAPLVILESILVNEEIQDPTHLKAFNYNKNNLSFSLSSLALSSFGNITYFYRCLPIEKNWIQITDASSIKYPNLQPGEYKFEAYVVDYFGKQSEPLTVEFDIKNPFWKTILFWFLIIGFIAFVTYKVITRRINRINQEKDSKTKLIQAEIDGLKAQINPHFVFNALNSIQALVIKQDIDKSNLYLGKFAQLLRRVLEYSSEKEITVEEEITLLSLYLDLEKLRFEDSIDISIQTNQERELLHLSIPPLVLQPYVENAIKHGLLHSKKSKKVLSISFEKEANYLICKIEDNGIGRVASSVINQRRSANHKSFATRATQQRIDLLNETLSSPILIEIKDLEEGTLVELRFPI